MKLSECKFGEMVITESKEVGHIVGVTYNVDISLTGGMSDEDKFNRTIPLVRFANGERGIHHNHLQKFRG
jgi:hypothetical protein